MNTVKKSVEIRLLTELLGTVPMNKKIYSTYIESLRPKGITGEEEAENIEEREQQGWTGFQKDENGLFVYDYYIKGFFKNAASVLKEDLKIKNLKSKVINLLFPQPRKIYLGCQEADHVIERPLRGQTPQGPMVTLAKSDALKAGRIIKFDVVLLTGKNELKEDIIEKLLEYGQYQGLGQFRNGGYGRFEIVKVK